MYRNIDEYLRQVCKISRDFGKQRVNRLHYIIVAFFKSRSDKFASGYSLIILNLNKVREI